MSRAFTKERDDAPEPQIVVRTPTEPQLMTASGLARLHEQRDAAATAIERSWIDTTIAAAVVVEPPVDVYVAAFGASVRVSGASADDRTFTIVGTHEADLSSGRVSVHSPLAEALIGSRVGDRVVWHRPAGDRSLTVLEILYR